MTPEEQEAFDLYVKWRELNIAQSSFEASDVIYFFAHVEMAEV